MTLDGNEPAALIFRLDPRSGISTWQQIVQQVRQAIRLHAIEPGDRLPTAQQVVGRLAINPNTVLKAYRELEHEGLLELRPGLGTFVVRGLPGPDPRTLATLRRSLERWLQGARDAGLDDDGVAALLAAARRDRSIEDIA